MCWWLDGQNRHWGLAAERISTSSIGIPNRRYGRFALFKGLLCVTALSWCSPVWLARMAPGVVLGGDGGDGPDLDELVRVAQDRDAEKGARHVVAGECGGDLVPGGDKVAASDVDGRLDHVADRGAGFFRTTPCWPVPARPGGMSAR